MTTIKSQRKNMKKLFSILMSAIFLMNIISSCKKSNDSTPVSSPINTIIAQGSWKVSLYSDKGNDETNNFVNDVFIFNSNGTVTATNGTNSATGTWSSGNDDSELKLHLNFGAALPFSELNDDWHVTQQNGALIKLEDVSGGNGGADYLNFEKI
jgi:hypothetical protein